MSTPTIPTAQEVQDHVRGAVRKGQEAALEVIKSVTDTVSALAPKIPAKVSELTRPLAEALPSPEAVAAKVHDLAEKALTEQRRLTEEALKATARLKDAATLKDTVALRPAAKDEGAAQDATVDEPGDEATARPSREPAAE